MRQQCFKLLPQILMDVDLSASLAAEKAKRYAKEEE